MVTRARARSAATAIQAVVLVLAFVGFTTVYRNSRCFSVANATRCSSLSGDHADAKSLFDSEFGPLEGMSVDGLVQPTLQAVSCPEPAPSDTEAVALTASPWHRPPPQPIA
jgi:hypothetical protein